MKQKSKKLFILISFFTAILSGCAASSVSAAIHQSADIAEQSFIESFRDFYAVPVQMLMRFNPCTCTDLLEFEANIYGQWRYVRIEGTSAAVEKFRTFARQFGSRQPFEYAFRLSDDLYQTPSGQLYYTLVATL